jgi:hypothetical protein
MFPLWFAFLGDSFVFLDVGPSILFFVFPFFGCFGLFMIGRDSSSNCSEAKDKNTHSHSFVQGQKFVSSQAHKTLSNNNTKTNKKEKKNKCIRERMWQQLAHSSNK